MNVGPALVANAQSSKAVKPTKGALNDPTPTAKPFTGLDTVRAIRAAIPRRRSQARCARDA
jgi:hypothetical protein